MLFFFFIVCRSIHYKVCLGKKRKKNYKKFQIIPVIVLFAIDVSVPRITRKFRVQWQFTFGTLQTTDVPTHVHRGQVETVVYRSTATGATSSVAAVLRIGCQSWTVNILQHIHLQNMTCENNIIIYVTGQ